MTMHTEAIVLHIRAHGEGAALVTVLCGQNGKMTGLVKGAKRQAAALQPGNIVEVQRFRRLDSQLGTFALSLVSSPAARCFDDFARLQFITYLVDILHAGLQEEEPHPILYQATREQLIHLREPGLWKRLSFYELQLLASLGYGLSLSAESAVPCEAGTPLTYVSPKSGRAVSAAVGQAYQNRLLPLPGLFGGPQKTAAHNDFLDVFCLTGHFLDRALHGHTPSSRRELLAVGESAGFKG